MTFSNFANKQLDKLPFEIQKRIVLTLRRCIIRPYPHVKKLVASKYFRLRVGDYRVILDIIDNKLIIHVIELGHRKNIYKKFT
ncbi:type II toxin-antitoxin system RelE/ParE family toxin [Candidatus Woesearchaeota archaeon]|nr:type II toxin-antitoxin system RelE/ParE family toxin [Candidatus Woesearchaeota archaeon]